jgi:hypothetical protein
MALRIASALIVAIVATPVSALAEGVRCGDQVIDVGDTALELETACGSPDHRDRRLVVENRVYQATRDAVEVAHVYEEVETWTYGAGDGLMMRIAEVRRGLVTAIRTVAVRRDRDLGRCLRASFASPALTGQVELACGRPDDLSRWVEERVLRTKRGLEHRTIVTHERWTYDPGPGRLIRIFAFEDGRLVRVTTGGRSGS